LTDPPTLICIKHNGDDEPEEPEHGNINNQGYYFNVINQNTHTCTYEKYLIFVFNFNHNSNVSTNLVKILNKNFHAVHSEVVELVHAGRPTDGGGDMMKLTFVFRNGVMNEPTVWSA
jgi:hypothetical protein